MLVNMHYNRIIVLIVLLLVSFVSLPYLVPSFPVNLSGLLHNAMSYLKTAGSRFHTGREILGTMITQEEVIGLRAQSIGTDVEEKKVDAKEIPKILHQIWLNFDGGFEHRDVSKGHERSENEEEQEKDEEEGSALENIDHESGWEVTGGESLDSMPNEWKQRRKGCEVVNKGWKILFWTSPKSLLFIKTHYPNWIDTYISYPHHWQRVQVLKYLLLKKHGGVVVDLDIACEREMDALVGTQLFVGSKEGWNGMGGRSAGWVDERVMGGVEGHEFFGMLVDKLKEGNWKTNGKGRFGSSFEDTSVVFEEVWAKYHDSLLKGTTGIKENAAEKGKKEPGSIYELGWRILTDEKGVGEKGFWGKHPSLTSFTTIDQKNTTSGLTRWLANKAKSGSTKAPGTLNHKPIICSMALFIAVFWISICCCGCAGGFSNGRRRSFGHRRGRERFRRGSVVYMAGTGAYLRAGEHGVGRVGYEGVVKEGYGNVKNV